MAHMKPLPVETTPELREDFEIFFAASRIQVAGLPCWAAVLAASRLGNNPATFSTVKKSSTKFTVIFGLISCRRVAIAAILL